MLYLFDNQFKTFNYLFSDTNFAHSFFLKLSSNICVLHMLTNVISKADLWAYRIHVFQESGLSRKDWCQQNEIPQSTLGYWIRRLQSETPETECTADPVFAKLPSEQELQFNAGTGNRSVTILLPENIRIEIGADCPARLLTTLLQALKNYA